MRKLVSVVLLPAVLCFATACSLASPSNQTIMISPSHPRAEIYVDGQLKGVGTQSVLLSKRRQHSVMAKCGLSSGVAMIDRNLSMTGVLDLIGGFLLLVPFIGLVSAGAWELSPNSVSVPIPDASACEV